MIRILDLVVVHLSADDEADSQVDEVEVVEAQEVGNILFNNSIIKWKKFDYLF